MYLSHFGLRARPFRTTPDLDGYYPASTHESALSELRRGIEDEEGLLLLQGEIGTGKTLVAHRLIESLPSGIRSALLTHGKFQSRMELLQAILFDLGLPYQEMSEQELRLSLLESCLAQFHDKGRTVVIIDEAHLLSAELLEELRLLGNLEGKEGKAIQVVLAGLPSLAEVIESPGLDIFRQRLAVCCRLQPLNIEESVDYLLHQLRRSGGRPERLFGEDVLDILSHASRGIPRVLNQAANLALRLAYESGAFLVDAEAAVEAVTQLGLDDPNETQAAQLQAPRPAAVAEPSPLMAHADASILAEPETRPTVYVYGGLNEAEDLPAEFKLPRAWPSTATQRAG